MTRESGTVVGVVGAGAMGAGIAQIAAAAGHRVVISDSKAGASAKARDAMTASLAKLVEKGKMTGAAKDELLGRISFVDALLARDLSIYKECGVVIEAVVEDLGVKRALFAALGGVVAPAAILATNTSSLSIASLASAPVNPERVVGIHFFNPAPVMPLVEIVPALSTSEVVTTAARALVDSWGKTTVLATDTPGFIVNRIARPFYGESLRLLEEGIADCATIDWAMKQVGGFRMGPFELMDFIGNDVNYAVSSSVFEGMFFDPRYKPALTQRRLVESGRLGRKTKSGYYDYRDGAVMPAPVEDAALGERISDRVIAMLMNEAVDALYLRIASAADIDTAMTKGVNYPQGLLAWCDAIGPAKILRKIDELHAEYGEDRYRASVLLRRAVKAGTKVSDFS
ncbi:MAG TPA: 3-hydroxyacyl-CoA dehydrogenase NAD-binding domain-containing protein [Gemmatimonadaceae bacterium]|nr:3-hydroxyacyl-CoA dehydrogenase NAD-binding domain-containing protein [Gemmatimonadaceae bacterium]